MENFSESIYFTEVKGATNLLVSSDNFGDSLRC